jgi:hypothetical protein
MSPQEPLLLVIAGSAIFTVGLLTLCAHFASALSRERILLWFGLFAAPYGLAVILRSILLPEWDARVDLAVPAGEMVLKCRINSLLRIPSVHRGSQTIGLAPAPVFRPLTLTRRSMPIDGRLGQRRRRRRLSSWYILQRSYSSRDAFHMFVIACVKDHCFLWKL